MSAIRNQRDVTMPAQKDPNSATHQIHRRPTPPQRTHRRRGCVTAVLSPPSERRLPTPRRLPSADQSRSAPPLASKVEEAVAQQAGDRQRDAAASSPAASTRRTSFRPSEAPRTRRARTPRARSARRTSCRPERRTASRSGSRDTRCLSTPALATRAMASPSDSMTDAMRKLPLSLTRLAAFGSSATTNVR